MQNTDSDSPTFPKTLTERVYNYLKDSIINGKIKANERIQEKEIASYFNISNTPVREAIKRLAGEGLINIDGHKISYVREISYKELIEIYHAMVCVDEMALKLAFNKKRETTIEEMNKIMTEMEKFAKKKTVDKYLELNERMHLRICELSENKFLYQIRKHIYDQLARYKPLRFFLFSKSGLIEKTLKIEKLLLKVFKSGDETKIKCLDYGQWIQFLPSEAEWIEHQSKNNETS